METHIRFLDGAVIAGYLGLVIAAGLYYARGQKAPEDYFLAGRTMGSLLLGISVIASLFSAISYLAVPTETYLRNTKYQLTLWTIPLASVFVVVVLLPLYRRLRVNTAYEYLEARFNQAVRTAASVLFIFARLGWMALVIWAPSLALSEVFNLAPVLAVLLVGVIATGYTVIGGIKAVIFTDFIQFFALLAGVVAVPLVVIRLFGAEGIGLGEMATMAVEGGKLETFDWSFALQTEQATVWAVLIAATVMQVGQYGTDQVAVQRYLAARSLKSAAGALWLNAALVVPVGLCFYAAGVFLWLFYSQLRPAPELAHPDRILPYFFVTEMPVGFAGLLIAALFAATMSSIDSGINSVSSVIVSDLYVGLLRRRRDPRAMLRLSKLITLAVGVIVTLVALSARYFGATLIEQTNTIAALFNGPLIGIFLLGVLTRRANWQGTLTGALAGALVCFIFTFVLKHGWFGLPVISVYFLWFTFLGTLPTVVVGYLASYRWPPPEPRHTRGLVFQWRLRYEAHQAEVAAQGAPEDRNPQP